MDEHLSELGRKVADARIHRGWSKEQAAREARISSITWKRVEDGLSVHDVKRAAVLRVLGLNYRGEPAETTERDLLKEAIESDPTLTDADKSMLMAAVDQARSNRPDPPPPVDASSEIA